MLFDAGGFSPAQKADCTGYPLSIHADLFQPVYINDLLIKIIYELFYPRPPAYIAKSPENCAGSLPSELS